MLTIEKILLQPELSDSSETIRLTPVQQSAADHVLTALSAALSSGSVLLLRGDPGAGKTTVLNWLHTRTGGVLIGMRHFVDMLMLRRPDAIEQSFIEILETAVTDHEIVLMDDFHLITAIASHYNYNRAGLLDAALEALAAAAERTGRKLILATDREESPWPVHTRAWVCDIGEFTPSDYLGLCAAYLNAAAATRLDYAKIHRFAPKLNARQLRNACLWLAHGRAPSTDSFIEYLGAINITSNVNLEEVQPVTWKDLKGMDDVIEALEAKIVLPFENSALAAELELKPKRGVLLAGPPGTGKTTIGRALAHRLKGKFFLIDGTVVAESKDFFCTLERIFERARRNAPSVIFIDDTDLIFESENKGFYRYLLTMLDGLESASAERVCVMMTAMEVSSIPAAILRSGRVELWLETRLPDLEARVSILRESFSRVVEPVKSADVSLLAHATRGLTGADLKAVVEDGKLLFAHDKANGKPVRAIEEYFLAAIATVRDHRRRYRRKKPAQSTEPVPFGFTG
jgi:transitional endoplasmic reticulum ATPase